MTFSIGSPPGGALTAAQVAANDKFAVVDTSVGASDNANKTMTAAELIQLPALIRPDGSALKTPLATSDVGGGTWSWVNQNGATIANDARGSLVLGATRRTADNISAIMRSLPATPYTINLEFDLQVPARDYFVAGIMLRDSGSGRMVSAGLTFDQTSYGGWALASAQYNSFSSFNASAILTSNNNYVRGTLPRFFRVTDNGTNFYFKASWDGLNFVDLKPAGTSRTSWLATPNQVGFGFSPYINTVDPGWDAMQMIIRDVYFT